MACKVSAGQRIDAIDKRVSQLVQQYYKGDQKKYQDALKQQGVSEEQLRQEIEAQERKQTAERRELRALRDNLEAQADFRARQRLAELNELERRLLREAETRRPIPRAETKPVIRPEHKGYR